MHETTTMIPLSIHAGALGGVYAHQDDTEGKASEHAAAAAEHAENAGSPSTPPVWPEIPPVWPEIPPAGSGDDE